MRVNFARIRLQLGLELAIIHSKITPTNLKSRRLAC